IVDDLDRVVFVFARLEAKLEVGFHRAREKLVVGAKSDDGLKAAHTAHEITDTFDDALDFVDQLLVFGEPTERSFAAFEAAGDLVEVVHRALEARARAIHALDGFADFARLRAALTLFALLQELAHLLGGDPNVFENPLDLGLTLVGDVLDVG